MAERSEFAPEEWVPDLDLGDDHFLNFASWTPDRELNPHYDGLPDVPKYSAIISHYKPGGGLCRGAITFAGDVQKRIQPDVRVWRVVSWEPLTLEPSILCRCGDHGFIREGKWVRA